MNTSEIIEKLGGDCVISDALGCEEVTIRTWRHRGWIPPRHWPALIRLARKRRVAGIKIDVLDEAYRTGMEKA